jgi:putative Holliday junction resolvase
VGRILAIDFGKKRVGLAVSDPLQIVANGLATVSASSIWEYLKDYFDKEKIDEVVIGYPVQMNNEPSEAVLFIDPFIKSFRKKYPDIRLELTDERFTSKIAYKTMIAGGLKKKARQNKGTVDLISATIILQSYMEHKRYIKNDFSD